VGRDASCVTGATTIEAHSNQLGTEVTVISSDSSEDTNFKSWP
jgi:hypothetical protein